MHIGHVLNNLYSSYTRSIPPLSKASEHSSIKAEKQLVKFNQERKSHASNKGEVLTMGLHQGGARFADPELTELLTFDANENS